MPFYVGLDCSTQSFTAAVIEADLWRIGQARPGSSLRFIQTDAAGAAEAEAALDHSFADLGTRLARIAAQHQAWR